MKKMTKNRSFLLFLISFLFFTQVNAQNQPPVDEFMGVNWQSNYSPEGTECVGFVREFSRWFDTQNEGANPNPPAGSLYPNECLSFNPDEGIPADLDFYYQELFNLGIEIVPAMMSTLPTYSGSTSTNPLERETWIPLQHVEVEDPPGSGNLVWIINDDGNLGTTNDAEIPANYVERADWMYHYVARYGSGGVQSCNIKVCSDDLFPDESNMGILNFVESWNEPNRTWTGDQADFTPEQYAAMASCDFDGHENSVIATGTDCNGNTINYPVGVINADPSISFVMGAPFDIEYANDEGDQGNGGFSVWDIWVEPMITWFENNRTDQAFVFDVLNFHHYSTSDPANPNTGRWICPEEDELRLKLEDIFDEMEARGWKNNLNNPDENRELWVSEFGYDTDESETNGWDFGNPTPQGEPTPTNPVFGNLFPEDLQAQWTIRSYLEMLAAGVDRAMVHELNDVIPAETSAAGWDQKTGLITLEGLPKASWYFVFAMRNILEGFTYAGDDSENCDYTVADFTNCDETDPLKPTRIYRFENATNERVWVIWSPTACDITPYEVEVDLLNGTEATGLRLAAPSINGVIEPVTVVDGIATVMASETPLFLVEENLEAPPCPEVSVTSVNCGSVSFDIDLPIGQNYDNYQVWFGQPVDPSNPDFSALGGDLTLFESISGNATSASVTGLEGGTTYSIYFVPQSPNGIPAEPCFQTVTTLEEGSICKIDVNDTNIATITYDNVLPGLQFNLFDNQDVDFCNGFPDLSSDESWLVWNDIAQLTITFTENYYFDNFFFFDGTSGGVFTVEFWNGTEWELLFNYFTGVLDDWNTVSDFEQPIEGINRVRLTAQSDRARLKELFICGQPVCDVLDVNIEDVTTDCSSAVVNVNEPPALCSNSFDLTVTEQPDLTGGEQIPITGASIAIPSAPVDYGDALIPGITYYSTTSTTNDVVTFTTASAGTGCISGPEICGMRFLGCSTQGFALSGNIPANAKVQFWLTTDNSGFLSNEHPLVTHPNATTQIVDIEPWYFGQSIVTLTGLIPEENYFAAYRYITETESSELFVNRCGNIFSFKARGIISENGSGCGDGGGGVLSFVEEDCDVVGVVLESVSGSYEIAERTNQSITPTVGALATANVPVLSTSSSGVYYELQTPAQTEYIYTRWSNGNNTKPWENVMMIDPCLEAGEKNAEDNVRKRFAKIYPNPARESIRLLCSNCIGTDLFSIDGRKLSLKLREQAVGQYQFDISQLPDGMYFLQVTNSEGEVEALRFVIQH